MKSYLLLALTFLSSTLAWAEQQPEPLSYSPTTEVSPCYRRVSGFARDLSDCQNYFICQNGQAVRARCPGNLAFDAENEACWWREEVTCFQCPRDQIYAMLPVPNTCHQFYRCWQGRATVHTCPNELVFDSRERHCNFIHGTGCEGDQTVGQTCPQSDGDEPVLLPDENSCSGYFLCYNGQPQPRQCAAGLHFNRILRACDIPENSNCMVEENPDDIWNEGVGGPVGDDQQVAIPCPVNGHGFVPHRSNCNAYFACTNQLPTLVNCAPGLHFDYERETCDRPQNARCWSHANQQPGNNNPFPPQFSADQ